VPSSEDLEIRGDGHVTGALDEILKPGGRSGAEGAL
jgi:hypothetical protein